MLIPSTLMLEKLLYDAAATITAGDHKGTFYGSFLFLFTNTPTLSQETVMGDFAEPTNSDYVRLSAAVAPSTWLSNDGSWDGLLPTLKNTLQTGTVVPQVIRGWGLADALTAGNFLAAEYFASPIELQTADEAVLVFGIVKLFSDVLGGYGDVAA